jgi:hypothetical protein
MPEKVLDKAERVFGESVTRARGYIGLARIAQASGHDDGAMRRRATEELQRFLDDDELIDAMCCQEAKECHG